jgi:hypothetical protein
MLQRRFNVLPCIIDDGSGQTRTSEENPGDLRGNLSRGGAPIGPDMTVTRFGGVDLPSARPGGRLHDLAHGRPITDLHGDHHAVATPATLPAGGRRRETL